MSRHNDSCVHYIDGKLTQHSDPDYQELVDAAADIQGILLERRCAALTPLFRNAFSSRPKF